MVLGAGLIPAATHRGSRAPGRPFRHAERLPFRAPLQHGCEPLRALDGLWREPQGDQSILVEGPMANRRVRVALSGPRPGNATLARIT